MKKLFPLLLVLVSSPVLADWVKISGYANTASPASEKFVDMRAIRQRGPMNTMRRVWEISNLAKGAPYKVLSIKSNVEYDCKNRRVRVLEESNLSEHRAQGENLTLAGHDLKPGNWSDINRGSVSETIFYRVCPNDD